MYIHHGFCFPGAALREYSANALLQSIQDTYLYTKGYLRMHKQPDHGDKSTALIHRWPHIMGRN